MNLLKRQESNTKHETAGILSDETEIIYRTFTVPFVLGKYQQSCEYLYLITLHI